MPTVQEAVLAEVQRGGKAIGVRRLFVAFSAHARRHYNYSAVKLQGSEGKTLLGRDEHANVTVDCASLADAFVELVNAALDSNGAERVRVGHPGGFATQEHSRCFDPAIVGNIRRPDSSWGDTGRCVFSEHYFVKTPNDTWWYLDPCMFTSYSTLDEVMSWKFDNGGGLFSSIIKRVVGDPTQVLIRVPPDDPAAKPPGFNSGFVVFKASDFTNDELLATKGNHANPQWNEGKKATHRDAALARVNKLLKRANVTKEWPERS